MLEANFNPTPPGLYLDIRQGLCQRGKREFSMQAMNIIEKKVQKIERKLKHGMPSIGGNTFFMEFDKYSSRHNPHLSQIGQRQDIRLGLTMALRLRTSSSFLEFKIFLLGLVENPGEPSKIWMALKMGPHCIDLILYFI